MRKPIACVAIAIVTCLGTVHAEAPGPAAPFAPILPQVKGQTGVAILLPSALPAPLKDSEIHFANGRGDARGYVISLFYEKGIAGEGLVGSFSGRAAQPVVASGERLALERGAIGYFKPRSCSASCAPSQIDWSLGGIHYIAQVELDLRDPARERATMVALANSAIAGGPR